MSTLTTTNVAIASSANRAGYVVPAVNVLYKLPSPAAVRRVVHRARKELLAARQRDGRPGVEWYIRSQLAGLTEGRAASRADVAALREWLAEATVAAADEWLAELDAAKAHMRAARAVEDHATANNLDDAEEAELAARTEARRAWRLETGGAIHVMACEVCGKTFIPARSDATTCSTSCRSKKSRAARVASASAV